MGGGGGQKGREMNGEKGLISKFQFPPPYSEEAIISRVPSKTNGKQTFYRHDFGIVAKAPYLPEIEELLKQFLKLS